MEGKQATSLVSADESACGLLRFEPGRLLRTGAAASESSFIWLMSSIVGAYFSSVVNPTADFHPFEKTEQLVFPQSLIHDPGDFMVRGGLVRRAFLSGDYAGPSRFDGLPFVDATGAAQGKNRTAVLINLPDYQLRDQPVPHEYGLRHAGRIVCTSASTTWPAWSRNGTRVHKNSSPHQFTPILKGNGTAIPAITYDMAASLPRAVALKLPNSFP